MSTVSEFSERVDRIMADEKDLCRRFKEAAERHSMVSSRGKVVIYVEDDPDQVSLLKTLFSVYSRLTVLPAATAEQGKSLIMAAADRIKCLVVDISLTGGAANDNSGLALLDWVKANFPNVPVIVLTGHSELFNYVKSRYPDVEFHVKSCEPMEKLVRAIEHSLSIVA